MSKFVDGIIGHAIGDAMGVPTEFCFRKKLLEKPITSMIGYGSHDVPAGTWSDDTSMSIALIDSIINKNAIDYDDIMHNFYDWLHDAKYTAVGEVFDAGRTCIQAIINYSKGYEPLECGLKDSHNNGNGSLMRILPIAFYCYYKKLNSNEIIELCNNISSLTHAHEISRLGCYIYVRFAINLLEGLSIESAYAFMQKDDYSKFSEDALEKYNRILKKQIKEYQIDDINSSGYVVDTLEAAFWILMNSKNYQECIIASTNIGQDTDTIGAVVGGLAGIVYGVNSIPKSWLDKLIKKDYLIELSLNFEKTLCDFNKDVLLGAIIGDVAGSRFEIVNNKYGKNFELFNKNCRFTDDTVMTLAVAKALFEAKKDFSDIKDRCIESMVEVGRKYPKCGYGQKFYQWIMSDKHEPYESFGNGSAMRIGPVGVVSNKNEEIIKLADIITNVSHNHIDSIKGSEAVCVAINMALNGKTKSDIKDYIEQNYFIISDLKENEMKPKIFHINCVETVKQSMQAFLDSYDFEDAIRNAIALGGDSDTIAAITGSLASAFYGIPSEYYIKVKEYLDDYLLNIYYNFNERFGKNEI